MNTHFNIRAAALCFLPNGKFTIRHDKSLLAYCWIARCCNSVGPTKCPIQNASSYNE